jgi:hypothetical protein
MPFTDDKEASLALLRDVRLLRRIDWQQLATIWRMLNVNSPNTATAMCASLELASFGWSHTGAR